MKHKRVTIDQLPILHACRIKDATPTHRARTFLYDSKWTLFAIVFPYQKQPAKGKKTWEFDGKKYQLNWVSQEPKTLHQYK